MTSPEEISLALAAFEDAVVAYAWVCAVVNQRIRTGLAPTGKELQWRADAKRRLDAALARYSELADPGQQ